LKGGRVRIGEAALAESALPFRSVVHEDPHFSFASSHAGTTARNIFTRCCRQEPRRQDYDRLDLTRQRKFRTIGRGKSESEVDEAAIALVELSVLVYDDIGTIGKTAAKLRDPRLGLFGKKGNRDADLEAEREIGESVSDLPKSINFW
jgi:hypothetical protein